MWIGVRKRFSRFHSSLRLTPEQLEDGRIKELGVRKKLHRTYYDVTTDHPLGFVVGSWGKGTAVSPPNDLDIFFELPISVYERLNTNAGNVQSQLLQEVRGHLLDRYPQTEVRGDNQVVAIGFNTLTVEVVPAFRYDQAGRFYMPDTTAGGRWRLVDPAATQNEIEVADAISNGNVRPLAMMIKTWKRECNVPIKSYQIELLVARFMSNYEYRQYDYFWYDWFVRDFFIFLCAQTSQELSIPGTGESVNLGDSWHSRAVTARDRALRACGYEHVDRVEEAGEEWQKIFGLRIPIA